MSKKRNAKPENPDSVRETFFGVLTQDVILSMKRQERSDTQATRRDLIRTMFAAIEGYVWKYREHVQSVISDIGTIPTLTELALSETSYVVTENGKVEAQTRFITLTSMIRLVSRLAEEHCPGLQVDFAPAGWSHLQKSIKIRNRITHPKTTSDLKITPQDIAITNAGFFWLLESITSVMESTNLAAARYLIDLKLFTDRLFSGDPQTIAEYQAAFRTLDD